MLQLLPGNSCGSGNGATARLGFDQVEHARQVAEWSADLAQAQHRPHQEQTGKPPPTSQAQLRTWLESVLPADQLARWPRTNVTGALSTAYKDLVRLVADVPSAHPGAEITGARESYYQRSVPRWLSRSTASDWKDPC